MAPPNPNASTSVRKRIERLFLLNLGKVLTREQIQEAAKDPKTNRIPENWHQRLSELRTDAGYTIKSWRDLNTLKPGQYLMESAERRAAASKRVKPDKATWLAVLARANDACEWNEGGMACKLKNGDIDPIGGGTVRLTADHVTPHSISPNVDPSDASKWRALCGRHQVMKKNFWDSDSGKLNTLAILQSASLADKKAAFSFLKDFFKAKKSRT